MNIGSLLLCKCNHNTNYPSNLYCLNRGMKFPLKGKIYTVRGFNNTNGVFVEEIINPCINTIDGGICEVGFHIEYFDEIEISENALENIFDLCQNNS